MNDVLDRKGAEHAAQEGENQFRTMVNVIPQLAWIAHADGFPFGTINVGSTTQAPYPNRWREVVGSTCMILTYCPT